MRSSEVVLPLFGTEGFVCCLTNAAGGWKGRTVVVVVVVVVVLVSDVRLRRPWFSVALFQVVCGVEWEP